MGWIIDLGPCPQKRCVSKWRAPTTFRRLSCEVSETAIVWQLSDDSPATFRRRAGDMFATFLVLSGGVPATDVLPDGGGHLAEGGQFLFTFGAGSPLLKASTHMMGDSHEGTTLKAVWTRASDDQPA